MSLDLPESAGPPPTSLLDLLREHLGPTGSKKGRNTGACGACTVLVDGHRVNSRLTPAVRQAFIARSGPGTLVVVDWPHRYLERTEVDARTAICVLTHDARFDIPLLRLALDLPVGYVGAMGSRRTHDERLRLLTEAGVTEERLARLRSPIGLDLGARTPEETAISITAEIVAHTNRGTGLPLSHCPARSTGTGLSCPETSHSRFAAVSRPRRVPGQAAE